MSQPPKKSPSTPATPSASPAAVRLYKDDREAEKLAFIYAKSTPEEAAAALDSATIEEYAYHEDFCRRMYGTTASVPDMTGETVIYGRRVDEWNRLSAARDEAAFLAEYMVAHETSDTLLAERFAVIAQGDLKFVNGKGWLGWSDTMCWAPEVADDRIKEATKKLSMELHHRALALWESDEDRAENLMKASQSILNKTKRTAVLEMAQKEPLLRCKVANLDTDPYLIAFQNGTLDARTMVLRPHDRADNVTMVLPVAYNPTAKRPMWDAMVTRLCDNDADLEAWMKRLSGYCLTGLTYARIFAIMFGVGRNLKSTWITAHMRVMGPYARALKPSMLMESRNVRDSGSASPDIAALAGARFGSATEIKAGSKLNDELVKTLTSGGDSMSARFLNQEEFTFVPTIKLLYGTNHVMRSTDISAAMKDRIRLIPCRARVTQDERDAYPNYEEDLLKELEGIAGWMVEGLADFMAHRGMGKTPQCVADASAEWFIENDVVAQWLGDRIHTTGNKADFIPLSVLHADFVTHCRVHNSGIGAMTIAGLGKDLRQNRTDATGEPIYPYGLKKGAGKGFFGMEFKIDDDARERAENELFAAAEAAGVDPGVLRREREQALAAAVAAVDRAEERAAVIPAEPEAVQGDLIEDDGGSMHAPDLIQAPGYPAGIRIRKAPEAA